MKNLNITFLKALLIIGLAPAVLAVMAANPLIGLIIGVVFLLSLIHI